MNMQHVKHDIQTILSCFSEAFSRPSFKIFSSFVMGFIHLGREAHTSAMVQSLSCSFLHRSLSSFTRFLGNHVWAVEEVAEIAVQQFFHRLNIKAQALLFLIIDDTLAPKRGSTSRDVPGIKIMRITWPMSLVTNGCSRLCSIGTSCCRWGLNSITPRVLKDVGRSVPRSPWQKASSVICAFLFRARSTCWRIVGTGPKRWSKFVARVAII